MRRETRHLAAMYLTFGLLVLGTATGLAVRPIPAAAGRLTAANSLTGQPEGGFREILNRRHWRMIEPQSAPAWAIVARGAQDQPVTFRYAGGGDARQALQQAGEELTKAAGRKGGGCRESTWSRLGSDWQLDLLLMGAPAGPEIRLRLVSPVRTRQLAMQSRPALKAAPKPNPRPQAPRPQPGPAASPFRIPTAPPAAPRVAIVIDDVGIVSGTERFIELPARLTFAILPFTPYGKKIAEEAAAAGRAVILHLPMEPLGGANPGSGIIRAGQSPEEIRAQLDQDLAAVPGAIGVNNHMGSLGTSEEGLMQEILASLKARGLFFLDSRTWSGSVAGTVAQRIRIPFASRDVFLDPDKATVEQIQAQCRLLIAIAKKHGTAIGICHANRPNTYAALALMLAEFEEQGVEIVPVSELVR